MSIWGTLVAWAEHRRHILPDCPFCKANDFKIVRPATLTNSRIQMANVRMGVQCQNCKIVMTASRQPDSSRWTFWGMP